MEKDTWKLNTQVSGNCDVIYMPEWYLYSTVLGLKGFYIQTFDQMHWSPFPSGHIFLTALCSSLPALGQVYLDTA